MGEGKPTTTVTLVEARVTVGVQPDDPHEAFVWLHNAARIVETTGGRYQVSRRRWYLTRALTWERSPAVQSDRYEGFQARTGFECREALSLARRVVLGEFDDAACTHPPAAQ